MTHRAAAYWRKLVQKERGPIPDEVWKEIVECEDDFISAANEEGKDDLGAGLRYLLERIELEEKKYLRYQAAGPRLPQQRRRELPQPKDTPPDARTAAFTKIAACLLDRNARVREFRKEALNGRLLRPEDVERWAEEVVSREGAVTTWTSPLRCSGSPLWDALSPLRLSWRGEAESVIIGTASGNPYYAPMTEARTLRLLKAMAGELAPFWPEEAATGFILTGVVPTPPPTSSAVCVPQSLGPDRITLTVTPHMSAEEVASLYLEARQWFLGKGHTKYSRQLTEKAITLAVFAAETPVSWSRRLSQWNKKYPQWKYPDKARSTFARDCRAAYKRVTGWEWKEK